MIKLIPAETSVQGLHLKECGGCEDCRPLHDHDQLALEREGQPRPSLEQHQGVHRSDGAGGGGQGEDVPGDHGGLPDLLGTSLPRHPGQLELGVEGRKEVDVSRGEGKVELAIHLLLDPKVSLHVAFVHSFVNPLLFVVLHKGCRWVKYMTKCLKPFKVDILLQLTRRATLDLLCCNFSQYSAREVAVTSNTEEDRWCAHNVRRSQDKEFKL